MDNTSLIILIVVLLILFGGGGGYFWTRRRYKTSCAMKIRSALARHAERPHAGQHQGSTEIALSAGQEFLRPDALGMANVLCQQNYG